MIPTNLARAIAANARNKGLRTDETTHAHECLKFREELCEAERALLDGDDEGHAREIADVAICLIGYAWEQGIDLDGARLVGSDYSRVEGLRSWVRALELAKTSTYHLAGFFRAIKEYAKEHDIDLLEAIRAKHAYNRTRPYGHKEDVGKLVSALHAGCAHPDFEYTANNQYTKFNDTGWVENCHCDDSNGWAYQWMRRLQS